MSVNTELLFVSSTPALISDRYAVYADPFGLMHCMVLQKDSPECQVVFFRDVPTASIYLKRHDNILPSDRSTIQSWLNTVMSCDSIRKVPFYRNDLVEKSLAVINGEAAVHVMSLLDELANDYSFFVDGNTQLSVPAIMQEIGIFCFTNIFIGDDTSRVCLCAGFDVYDYHGYLVYNMGESTGRLEERAFHMRESFVDQYLFSDEIAQWNSFVNKEKTHDNSLLVMSGLITLLVYIQAKKIRKKQETDETYYGFPKLSEGQLHSLMYKASVRLFELRDFLFKEKRVSKKNQMVALANTVQFCSAMLMIIDPHYAEHMKNRNRLIYETVKDALQTPYRERNFIAQCHFFEYKAETPDWAFLQVIDKLYFLFSSYNTHLSVLQNKHLGITSKHRFSVLCEHNPEAWYVKQPGEYVVDEMNQTHVLYGQMAQDALSEVRDLGAYLPSEIIDQYSDRIMHIGVPITDDYIWSIDEVMEDVWVQCVEEIEKIRDDVFLMLDSGEGASLMLKEFVNIVGKFNDAVSILSEGVPDEIAVRMCELQDEYISLYALIEEGHYNRTYYQKYCELIRQVKNTIARHLQILEQQKKVLAQQVRKRNEEEEAQQYQVARAKMQQNQNAQLCEKKAAEILDWVVENRPDSVKKYTNEVKRLYDKHTEPRKKAKAKIRYSKVLRDLESLWQRRTSF